MPETACLHTGHNVGLSISSKLGACSFLVDESSGKQQKTGMFPLVGLCSQWIGKFQRKPLSAFNGKRKTKQGWEMVQDTLVFSPTASAYPDATLGASFSER